MLPLLLFLTETLGTCPGTPECSGHGYCKANNKCYCGLKRGMEDCSFDFTSLSTDRGVLALQWSGFVWYFALTVTAAYCTWNIARVKCLKWGLWYEVGNLNLVDTQQLPLICCFVHCLLGTISFGLDPYYVHSSISPTLIASMFQAEVLALFVILFNLVRFWMDLITKFQHKTAGYATKSFDIVSGLCLLGEIVGWIVFGQGSSLPPTDERNERFVTTGTVLVCATYVFYIIFLLVFGFHYGCKMREYLKKGNSFTESSKATLTALRKITRLLIGLCGVGTLGVLVTIVNLLLNIGTIGKGGSQAFYSSMTLYILLHAAFGILLAVVLFSLGRPTEFRHHHYFKKTLSKERKITHLSKKSGRPREFSSASVEREALKRANSAGRESTKPYSSSSASVECEALKQLESGSPKAQDQAAQEHSPQAQAP